LEEGSIGGFGAQVGQHLANTGLLDHVRFRPMTLPDIFIDHNTQEAQYEQAGLTAPFIVKTALSALGIGDMLSMNLPNCATGTKS
ncbi:MAG: 1-deoxy-D-xylulose-5-phosphate synthase, partial [Acetobacter persici]